MAKPLDIKGPAAAAAIKPTSATKITIPGVMGPNPDYQMLARMFPTPPSVEHVCWIDNIFFQTMWFYSGIILYEASFNYSNRLYKFSFN